MLIDMEISTRLTILLFILLAGLVIAGKIGLYAAGRSNSAMKPVYEDRVMPIMQLNTIYAVNLGNRLAIFKAITRPGHTPEFIQEIAGQLNWMRNI